MLSDDIVSLDEANALPAAARKNSTSVSMSSSLIRSSSLKQAPYRATAAWIAPDRISIRPHHSLGVMPALVAGIHVLQRRWKQDVDGRDEPGHDSKCSKLTGIRFKS